MGRIASERTGWATQKPLKLLRRIIKASSNKDDLVLVPFAGCATCCVAAAMEGREWVAIEACVGGRRLRVRGQRGGVTFTTRNLPMRTTAPVAALLLAATAFGSETVIEVPQGSGVFPTVGQVDCLEEMGSGRFCAATYECADESGDLWGDLANHDGRRAIGVDSPVARERDCTITVDGKAAVRWFVGFSPDGRNGDLVGLTAKHDALKPVHTVNATRVVQGGSEGDGSFLSWFVDRFNIGDFRTAWRGVCPPGYLDDCVEHSMAVLVADVMPMENTPVTRCAAELIYDYEAAVDGLFDPTIHTIRLLTRNRWSNYIYATVPDDRSSQTVYELLHRLAVHEEPYWAMEGHLPGRYAECRRLLMEQWEREGFGELQ